MKVGTETKKIAVDLPPNYNPIRFNDSGTVRGCRLVRPGMFNATPVHTMVDGRVMALAQGVFAPIYSYQIADLYQTYPVPPYLLPPYTEACTNLSLAPFYTTQIYQSVVQQWTGPLVRWYKNFRIRYTVPAGITVQKIEIVTTGIYTSWGNLGSGGNIVVTGELTGNIPLGVAGSYFTKTQTFVSGTLISIDLAFPANDICQYNNAAVDVNLDRMWGFNWTVMLRLYK